MNVKKTPTPNSTFQRWTLARREKGEGEGEGERREKNHKRRGERDGRTVMVKARGWMDGMDD